MLRRLFFQIVLVKSFLDKFTPGNKNLEYNWQEVGFVFPILSDG